MQSATPFSAAVFVLVLAVCGQLVTSQPQRSAFGNDQDLNKYLSNPQYVEQQINCVLDRGSCDKIGRNLKAAIPLALKENCRACSSTQVNNARKLGSFISERYPREWREIQARYGSK